jgi:hypothetical protein
VLLLLLPPPLLLLLLLLLQVLHLFLPCMAAIIRRVYNTIARSTFAFCLAGGRGACREDWWGLESGAKLLKGVHGEGEHKAGENACVNTRQESLVLRRAFCGEGLREHKAGAPE